MVRVRSTHDTLPPDQSPPRQPARSPDGIAWRAIPAGRALTWRYRLRATHAGSWRDVLATSGRRIVWVELGREYRADLDWDASRPPADFPKYPSLAYLEQLAQGTITRGL